MTFKCMHKRIKGIIYNNSKRINNIVQEFINIILVKNIYIYNKNIKNIIL